MKRIQIGNVSADHGRILIIDPSRIFHTPVQREIDGGGMGREGKSGMYCPERWEQLGGEGSFSAVISHTPVDDSDGDGIYPVTAVLDSEDRLVRLEIGFLD